MTLTASPPTDIVDLSSIKTVKQVPYTEYFVSGSYSDRIAVAAGRLNFREKICVLDSDVPPESLIYPI